MQYEVYIVCTYRACWYKFLVGILGVDQMAGQRVTGFVRHQAMCLLGAVSLNKQPEIENTIRDGGSHTCLHCLVNTVYTVYTVQTALPCLNNA